ncbi:MAG: hypothetical protein WAN16_11195 [Chthoniobacterales bacterium]
MTIKKQIRAPFVFPPNKPVNQPPELIFPAEFESQKVLAPGAGEALAFSHPLQKDPGVESLMSQVSPEYSAKNINVCRIIGDKSTPDSRWTRFLHRLEKTKNLLGIQMLQHMGAIDAVTGCSELPAFLRIKEGENITLVILQPLGFAFPHRGIV